MGHAARRLLAGLLVLVGVTVAVGAVTGSGASSTPSQSELVEGIVEADGSAVVRAGWTVDHPAPGYYVVRSPAERTELDVETWDGPAEVSYAPVGDGDVEVRFLRDGQPVDVRFSWRALVER